MSRNRILVRLGLEALYTKVSVLLDKRAELQEQCERVAEWPDTQRKLDRMNDLLSQLVDYEKVLTVLNERAGMLEKKLQKR